MEELLTEICTATTRADKNYYYSPILDNDNFYYSHNNNNDHHRYHSEPHPPNPLQNQKSNTTTPSVERRIKEPFYKRILIVDDHPDITLAFKSGLEGYYHDDSYSKIRFEVSTYNNPLEALSEFKPNFYDLLLTDINMPIINGFELCQKILELDANVRVCFITAGEANIDALREVYPNVSMGCFIKKPVTIDYLVKRLRAELD
jgi:CheY-like chemotaxis protein